MLLTFLLSPLGRKIGIGILVLILLTGLYWKIYSNGKESGRQEGVSSQLDVDRQTMEKERAEFQKNIQASQDREKAATDLIAKYQTLLDQTSAALSTIKNQRIEAQTKVTQVPDNALQQDIVAKLATRPITDTSPSFYPQELRKLDEIVSDYPLIQRQIELQNTRFTALEGKIEGLGNQLKAVQDEREQWKILAKQMQEHYQRAYNAIPKHGNFLLKIITLGRAGKPPKLDLPDPEKLLPRA